jgi:hypothetical protein
LSNHHTHNCLCTIRTHVPNVYLNVDACRQHSPILTHQSTSILASKRMIGYPTPPRSQSRATSICGSSAPTTPSSQGLGLLNCPFPSRLIDNFTAFSSSSYPTTTAVGDWSVRGPMRGNAHEEDLDLSLLSAASISLPGASLDAIAFYPSPALPSSSRPMSCANIDFTFTQNQASAVLQDNFQRDSFPLVKQEEDLESWFNDHVYMNRSQSSMELSSHRIVKSPSLSPHRVPGARLVPSPAAGLNTLSPASFAQSQQLELSPTVRSESVESHIAFRQSTNHQNSVKARRHSATNEKRYICPVCNRPFEKKYNLREHEKKHDPSRVSQFVCPEPGCGKRLGRKTDVNRHVQSVHEKAKKFACNRCFKRFDRKDTLSR